MATMAIATPAPAAVSFSARPAVAVPDRRRSAVSVGAAGKWWAPLVGWSGRADYLEPPAPAPPALAAEEKRAGLLTEEKARQLRARMVETESFHDGMYHSAIASRLARSSA